MRIKRLLRRTALILVAAGLSSCVGPLVQVSKVDDQTADELGRSIMTFDAASTPPGASVLGPLTATSCKNNLGDKAATPEDATNQLRLLSRQRGGNAVGNLTCEAPEGTNLAKNCWESVVCTGTSIRVSGQRTDRALRR